MFFFKPLCSLSFYEPLCSLSFYEPLHPSLFPPPSNYYPDPCVLLCGRIADKIFTFAMGHHKRLGVSSLVRVLEVGVLDMMLKTARSLMQAAAVEARQPVSEIADEQYDFEDYDEEYAEDSEEGSDENQVFPNPVGGKH